MGRPRKITAAQTGNLTTEFQLQRSFEEQLAASPAIKIKSPPRWLIDSTAKKEWKRVVPLLTSQMDIIGDLDIANLGGYCNAYAQYVKATAQLEEEPLTIESDHGPKPNPLIAVQKQYAEEMRSFAGKCGLTIDSRLKLAAEKAKKIDEDISGEFGDI